MTETETDSTDNALQRAMAELVRLRDENAHLKLILAESGVSYEAKSAVGPDPEPATSIS
jgi:hypothetical protein